MHLIGAATTGGLVGTAVTPRRRPRGDQIFGSREVVKRAKPACVGAPLTATRLRKKCSYEVEALCRRVAQVAATEQRGGRQSSRKPLNTNHRVPKRRGVRPPPYVATLQSARASRGLVRSIAALRSHGRPTRSSPPRPYRRICRRDSAATSSTSSAALAGNRRERHLLKRRSAEAAEAAARVRARHVSQVLRAIG